MTIEHQSKRSVLIIDPQPNMAMLVATMLRGIGRWEVTEANDAKHALMDVSKRAFGIIIVDDGITSPDAVALFRQIRTNKNGHNQLTPIIMMAAAPDAPRIAAARDAGVTEFLRKPFAAAHLKSRLDSIAAQPRGFIEAEAYSGPDRRRRTVDVGEKNRREQ